MNKDNPASSNSEKMVEALSETIKNDIDSTIIDNVIKSARKGETNVFKKTKGKKPMLNNIIWILYQICLFIKCVKRNKKKIFTILAYIMLTPLAVVCMWKLAVLCYLVFKAGWVVWFPIISIVSALAGAIILFQENKS